MINLERKSHYGKADEKELFFKHKLDATSVAPLKKRIEGFLPKLAPKQTLEILLILCDVLPYEQAEYHLKSSMIDMVKPTHVGCGPLHTYSSPSRRNSLSVERRTYSEERPSSRPSMPNRYYKENGTQALFGRQQLRVSEGRANNKRAGFPNRVNLRAEDNSSYSQRRIRGH